MPDAVSEPQAPEPQIGDRVRLMASSYYRPFPGGPVERPVHVCDGRLVARLPAGADPRAWVALGYLPPRARASKYDRVVLELRTSRRPRTFTLDRTTRLFRHDLAA